MTDELREIMRVGARHAIPGRKATIAYRLLPTAPVAFRSIHQTPDGGGGSSAFVASITEVDDDGVEERTQAQRYISQAPTAG